LLAVLHVYMYETVMDLHLYFNNRSRNTHIHTYMHAYTHVVLTAIFPGKHGLAGCPSDFPNWIFWCEVIWAGCFLVSTSRNTLGYIFFSIQYYSWMGRSAPSLCVSSPMPV